MNKSDNFPEDSSWNLSYTWKYDIISSIRKTIPPISEETEERCVPVSSGSNSGEYFLYTGTAFPNTGMFIQGQLQDIVRIANNILLEPPTNCQQEIDNLRK